MKKIISSPGSGTIPSEKVKLVDMIVVFTSGGTAVGYVQSIQGAYTAYIGPPDFTYHIHANNLDNLIEQLQSKGHYLYVL